MNLNNFLIFFLFKCVLRCKKKHKISIHLTNTYIFLVKTHIKSNNIFCEQRERAVFYFVFAANIYYKFNVVFYNAKKRAALGDIAPLRNITPAEKRLIFTSQ